ncbi:phosphonoacetaldehyde reductase [Vibrio kasasachensis]|uniref:phosphonoacetaldehyde reductase n=1 Tax=Vibrio kasasachensis TaxID=2910248 RepID=UPI003D0AAB62
MFKGIVVKICHGRFENELTDALNRVTAKRVFVVCGKKSFLASGAKGRLAELENCFEVTMFSDFSENPTAEEVSRAYQECLSMNADAVIAIGGGSAIDIAKGIIGLWATKTTIDTLLEGSFQIVSDYPYFIAIPTTSGSGSESTHFAVVYKGDAKFSVANEALLPQQALIDGSLTFSMSKKQAACSGLDAFCQAIESFWAKSATKESKTNALTSLKILHEHLVSSVNNQNRGSREKCIEAANYAGQAINVTKTTAPHAFSYHLTKKYDIPHGLAVALSMSVVLRASLKNPVEYDAVLSEVYEVLKIGSLSGLVDLIESMLKSFSLPFSLCQIGCTGKSNINAYISGVNLERLNNHPVKIDVKLLMRVIEG